jgi:hypothetical protein
VKRPTKPGDVEITFYVSAGAVHIEWKLPRGQSEADALRVLRGGLFQMLDAIDTFQKGRFPDGIPEN